MARQQTSETVDRLGQPLSDPPDPAELADRLRIVDESDLSPQALARLSPAELEQRSLRSQER